MKLNKYVFSVPAIILALCTIVLGVLFFLHAAVNIKILMMSLGLTQVFGGLNQINVQKKVDSKENRIMSLFVGLFSIIVGILIVVGVVIKIFG